MGSKDTKSNSIELEKMRVGGDFTTEIEYIKKLTGMEKELMEPYGKDDGFFSEKSIASIRNDLLAEIAKYKKAFCANVTKAFGEYLKSL